MRTRKQRLRCLEYRDTHGRFTKVNPCYCCGKSAGFKPTEHPMAWSEAWGHRSLLLCAKCLEATKDMVRSDFLKYARGRGGLYGNNDRT